MLSVYRKVRGGLYLTRHRETRPGNSGNREREENRWTLTNLRNR